MIGHQVKCLALTVAFEFVQEDGKRPVEKLAVASAEQAATGQETIPVKLTNLRSEIVGMFLNSKSPNRDHEIHEISGPYTKKGPRFKT